MTALFLVISNPRPERPSELAARRQSFWPWIGKYQADGAGRSTPASAAAPPSRKARG